MNKFERATKQKLRFETSKGFITTEDVWDLPLKSRGADLNKLAKKYNKLLKDDTETDFVDGGNKDPGFTANQLRFDIILSVIDYKKSAAKLAELKSNNRDRENRIKEALENKKDSALLNMSEAELEAELAKLRS